MSGVGPSEMMRAPRCEHVSGGFAGALCSRCAKEVQAERDAALAERAEYAEVTAALRADNQALRERLARVRKVAEAVIDSHASDCGCRPHSPEACRLCTFCFHTDELTAALGEPAG